MKKKILIITAMLFFSHSLTRAQTSYQLTKTKIQKVIIEGQLNSQYLEDSIELRHEPVDFIGIGRESQSVKGKVIGQNVRMSLYFESPQFILCKALLGNQRFLWITEPGDSITISGLKDKLSFFGRGAEKFQLQYQLDRIYKEIKSPVSAPIRSVNDFIEWHRYLDEQLKQMLPIIEFYRDKVSEFAYECIKSNVIIAVEKIRVDKFWQLFISSKKIGLQASDLVQIHDSTLNGPAARWVLSFPNSMVGSDYYYARIRNEVFRKYNFESDEDELTRENRRMLYYELAKKKFKGLTLEKFLLYFITYKTISGIGFTSETEKILNDYYSLPGFPEYKKYVKSHELSARNLRRGQSSPNFTLIDVNGKYFTSSDLKDKVVLIDFWFTGCVGCAQIVPLLRKIEKEFEGDTSVLFLSVSIDDTKSKWLSSIKKGTYTTGTAYNLIASSPEDRRELIKNFNLSEYPTVFLFDAKGRIVQNPLPDLRLDTGKSVIALIKKQIVFKKDGPYVFENADSLLDFYYFDGLSVKKTQLNKLRNESFRIQTDLYGRHFEVQMKKEIKNESSYYQQPSKTFVISDIEGNFEALRKLLQSNRIINDDFKWTYGSGHLVLLGDVFDRGEQVNECLWLIYSLEEKAKKAGGYVHFILGNHEIMNLNGNTRYVQRKYTDNVSSIGMSHTQAYGAHSELGRWLRSKNIVEKIGNVIYVHAGVSQEMLELTSSLEFLNSRARCFYDKERIAQQSSDKNLHVLFHSRLSPFWYRLYYQDAEMKVYASTDTMYKMYKTPLDIIDKTLKKYGVDHIVTGHTIVGDSISLHYSGKVINTDTPHALGLSEGLLVENGHYYRVNLAGAKALIFNESKRARLEDAN